MSRGGAVWVTGMGAVAPNGIGVEDYWDATLQGRSGLYPISRFDASAYPVRVAGEVLDFDAARYLSPRLLAQTDRMTRYALAAADWAVADADVRPGLGADLGVVTAAAAGGFEFGQRELGKLWGEGPDRVSAYQSFAWFYAVNTGQISIRHGLRGASSVLVSGQAGGLDAIAQSARMVRKGTNSLVLTGGFEASVCPWGVAAQSVMGGASTEPDPRWAYRPFDERATGSVPGEGGAALVVESAAGAAERGARRAYGRISGHAATFDPPPGSGRGPGLARAIRLALRDGGVPAGAVDAVFADADGSPDRDRVEIDALSEVFGVAGVPVTAPKSMTGRLDSGGAPLDVVAALLSLRDGVLPPTIGARSVPPELDLVLDAPRELPLRTVLVLARGQGGFNSALVLSAV
ncbi:ketosynthase chain-length factor [Saccharopolyspora gloriosae]|uniref:Act minimal PKS chain-length factor (CLF/KS beta) n=1 Tax=Saccharopolyspora gloriosae TaxID=455344 RepID=A0A840NI38_9PSEU|nr:beta-ketoacyl synthase N-terminal-like domain-containing protein [Saccharopolyspora gloriosae]MBB5069853.1 act minimal PKS chain-length factor (CLF/KS beta) [Saccharopolyspora gloriosae]